MGWFIAAQWTATFQDLLCVPVYYLPASPISVANHRNRSTGTCESCWSFPKLCPKCDPVTLSGIHIHRAGVQQFHYRWDTFCIKNLYPFLFCKWPYRPRCPVSRPTTMDSCWLLMLSSVVALLCWGPSIRTLECLVLICPAENWTQDHCLWENKI